MDRLSCIENQWRYLSSDKAQDVMWLIAEVKKQYEWRGESNRQNFNLEQENRALLAEVKRLRKELYKIESEYDYCGS